MDVVGRKAKRAGQYVELTAREFELLEYLLRHKEQVVSREMLAREVWKEVARATPLASGGQQDSRRNFGKREAARSSGGLALQLTPAST
jgi:hypothetical protein